MKAGLVFPIVQLTSYKNQIYQTIPDELEAIGRLLVADTKVWAIVTGNDQFNQGSDTHLLTMMLDNGLPNIPVADRVNLITAWGVRLCENWG